MSAVVCATCGAQAALHRAAAALALRAPAVVREEMPLLRFQFARTAGRAAVRGIRRGAGARSRGDAAVGLGPARPVDLHRRRHAQPVSRRSRSTRCWRRCARACRSSPDAEITLEANPGTSEAGRFRGYRDAGVNRLSLGVQSFDDAMLKALGRIHSRRRGAARDRAWRSRLSATSTSTSCTACPGRRSAMARADIEEGVRHGTPHLSAYQLTIEPNTVFFSHPPTLPEHDAAADMQVMVEETLARPASSTTKPRPSPGRAIAAGTTSTTGSSATTSASAPARTAS